MSNIETQQEFKMLDKKSWQEFRESGLFWWVNTLLHTFGWALVVEIDDDEGKIINAYPARTKFRGFDYKSNDEGYKKVTQYMINNGEELLKECE